jgi:hypothetical protein
MKKRHRFLQSFDELPAALPIFPLSNAVLLPGGILPLNIFETRYLNMVQDAMRDDQLIGMIQPSDRHSPPHLFNVGCAGRITRYIETHDERIELSLTGLCRFKVQSEHLSSRGYRIADPNWTGYEADFAEPEPPDAQIAMTFKNALKNYFSEQGIQADFDMLSRMHINDLANNLLSYLPLSPEDKQLLIETDTDAERLVAFTAILLGDHSTNNARH